VQLVLNTKDTMITKCKLSVGSNRIVQLFPWPRAYESPTRYTFQ